MKVAVPLDTSLDIYRYNPCTAPHFGIYTIKREDKDVTFSLHKTVENPWVLSDGEMIHSDIMREGKCDVRQKNDPHHLCEHYLILEAIHGCCYLLAQTFCENTKQSMTHAGVKLFQVPPFIRYVDQAIKNFLIGAEIVYTVKHIHHAS